MLYEYEERIYIYIYVKCKRIIRNENKKIKNDVEVEIGMYLESVCY